MNERRRLTEGEVEESVRFADSALAAAGHQVDDADSDADIRAALRGEITYDEAVRRAIAGATSSQREDRRRRVGDALTSGRLEGHPPPAEFVRDAEDYINGDIDEEELVERGRRRWGLTDPDEPGSL